MNATDFLDLDALRLNGSELKALASSPSTKPPRHRPGERFLKGPVPWPWLEQAARLPGQALALSLILWREANRSDRRTVKLSLRRLSLGVSEYAGRRALRSLEAAGLVTVRRPPGSGLEVTILDAPPTDN